METLIMVFKAAFLLTHSTPPVENKSYFGRALQIVPHGPWFSLSLFLLPSGLNDPLHVSETKKIHICLLLSHIYHVPNRRLELLEHGTGTSSFLLYLNSQGIHSLEPLDALLSPLSEEAKKGEVDSNGHLPILQANNEPQKLSDIAVSIHKLGP